jgi:penicillin amidase
MFLLTGAGFLSVCGLAVTAAYFYFESSADQPGGSVSMPFLEGRVQVLTDTFGIPHLFAGGELDLLRAQGYVHASDRLWQMELFRRIASGRLAELFGERALSTDRFMRTLDLWGAAGRTLVLLDDDERARLEAYAEGVNARIDQRDRPIPPEFVLTRIRPEAWDARSSLAIAMVMNLDLSHWRNDLSRYWASSRMPPEKLAYLRLGYPDWGPTILDEQGGNPVPGPDPVRARVATEPATAGSNPAEPSGLRDDERWDPLELLRAFSIRVASNAWVVAGSRSASGVPILANDMHLGLRSPALWYLAALHADSAEVHVAGLTLPGVPGVIVGYNRDLAWGFTNGMVDDMDFVVEEVRPGGTYRHQSGWLQLAVRPETIQVRAKAPEVWEVRETVRGPLISDVLDGLDGDIAAAWVAARPVASRLGLWDMNVAGSAAEFDLAVQRFAQPHQNVVFADRSGRIGYRLAGRVPVRTGWDGTIPVSPDVFGRGWSEYLPPHLHPAVLDPGSGFIATANNLQSRGLGNTISTDYAAPFRAMRISQALAVRRDWSVRSMYEFQHDTRSLLADRTVDRAIAAAQRLGADEAADLLEAWDRRVEVRSRAAPLFYSWLYRVRTLIAADEYAETPEWGFFPLTALLVVLDEGDENPWVDDVTTASTETLAELEEQALVDALAAIDGRAWGQLHFERNAHPLGNVSWLQSLFGFDVGPYPVEGGPNTVRPDDYRRWGRLDSTSWMPPWISEYGSSERFVAELGQERSTGYFLLPTGQSGNPFSDHYRDMNDRWRGGELIEVPLSRIQAQRRARRQLNLIPDRRRSDLVDEEKPHE